MTNPEVCWTIDEHLYFQFLVKNTYFFFLQVGKLFIIFSCLCLELNLGGIEKLVYKMR